MDFLAWEFECLWNIKFRNGWLIDAPIEEVWAKTHDILEWPLWWDGVKDIEEVDLKKDNDGEGSVYRSHIKSKLPYTLVCRVHLRKSCKYQQKYYELTSGDLNGWAVWRYRREGQQTWLNTSNQSSPSVPGCGLLVQSLDLFLSGIICL